MNRRVRILSASLEAPRAHLGDYTPASRSADLALHALVTQAAKDLGPHVFLGATEDGAELDLRTSFLRLEPEGEDRPFATAQVVVEVLRRSTGQVLYTRKAETEARRILAAPVPLDDPRFERTALGRAVHSCLRGVFTGLVETLVAAG